MALEVLLEECLKEPDAVRVGEAVEAEPNPCLRRALDDERTRAPVESVGMTPDPASFRRNECKRKGVEYAGSPEPDVFVPADDYVGLKLLAAELPQPAVDAVAG